jgi:hypothetical protein
MTTFVNDNIVETFSASYNPLIGAISDNDFITSFPSPKIDPIIALVWSSKSKGYWSGHAETRVQRAISCLTRSFSGRTNRINGYSTLLWSLAGLEALFCDSSSSVLYQIRRRAPLLNSEFDRNELDKHIKSGYNFRSRLFHGDVQIRSLIAEDDEFDDKHHEIESEKYSDFFALLLSRCISFCIEKSIQEVTFREAVDFN